jgi:hypothetical protein
MVLSLRSAAAIGVLGACLAWSAPPAPHTVTWTGWFSETKCGPGKIAGGKLGPTNPQCSEHCIKEGAAPVFISEQAKALFEVKGGANVIDDLGYHLEVQGLVDDAAKTITIQKVTRLGFDGAACSRPKKTAAKQ